MSHRSIQPWRRAGILAAFCTATLVGCQLPNTPTADAKTLAAAKAAEDDDAFARKNETTPAELKKGGGGNAFSDPMMSSLSLPPLPTLGSRPCRT